MDRRAEEHVYELVQRSAEGHRLEGLRLGDRPAGWVDADTVARGTIKTEEATRQVSCTVNYLYLRHIKAYSWRSLYLSTNFLTIVARKIVSQQPKLVSAVRSVFVLLHEIRTVSSSTELFT